MILMTTANLATLRRIAPKSSGESQIKWGWCGSPGSSHPVSGSWAPRLPPLSTPWKLHKDVHVHRKTFARAHRTVNKFIPDATLGPHMEGSDPNPLEGSGVSYQSLGFEGPSVRACFTERLGSSSMAALIHGKTRQPTKQLRCDQVTSKPSFAPAKSLQSTGPDQASRYLEAVSWLQQVKQMSSSTLT